MKAAVIACFLAFVAVAATEDLAAKVAVLPELTAEKAAALAQEVIAKSVSEEAALSKLPPSEELTKPLIICRPTICPALYSPLCGFSLCNGVRTFSNTCELSNYNRCNYPDYILISGY